MERSGLLMWWMVAGWILGGLVGFIIGLVTEKYISRWSDRRRSAKEWRKKMGGREEETTQVTRIRKE